MDLETLYSLLGKRVKYLRETAGLTQEQLAEKAGIGLVHMGKIEVNISQPSISALLKIANALNVSLKDLFDI